MDQVNGKYPAQTFKVKIVQEYEVEIFYQQGIIAADDDELYDIVTADALELSTEDDGLGARDHDETATSNGYISHTTTYDPSVQISYSFPEMTKTIKRAMALRGL